MKNKGFTLIELLVVIAIIGILASVVLVAFPSANKRAKDARIITAIAQSRTIMTYINANDGNYTNFYCTTNCSSCSNTELTPICNEIMKNGGTPNFTRKSDNTLACIFSPLNISSSKWFCADSNGRAGIATTTPDAAGWCQNGSATFTGCPGLEAAQ